jgi:hypothetical protein
MAACIVNGLNDREFGDPNDADSGEVVIQADSAAHEEGGEHNNEQPRL